MVFPWTKMNVRVEAMQLHIRGRKWYCSYLLPWVVKSRRKKERRASLGLFCIQPCNTPPGGGFRNPFSLWRINNALSPQAAHTDPPSKNHRQLSFAAFFSAFFCVCSPDIISKPSNKNKKFFIPQCTIENSRTKTMVTRCQKNARHVFMFSSDKYKKAHQARFSTEGYMWTTLSKYSTQM